MNLPSGPREGAPTPSQYSGAAAAPSVRFEVIGEAFQMFKDAPVPWVVGTLMIAMGYLVAYLLAVATHSAALAGLFLLIVYAAVFCGLSAMAVKQARGESVSLADMREALPVAGNLILFYFVTGLITLLSTPLLCIGPFLVATLTMLAVPAIIDQRVSAFDGLRISFRALKAQWLMAACLLLVLMAMLFVSGIVIVPELVAVPVYLLAIAITYRDLVLAPLAYEKAPAGYGAAPLMSPPHSSDRPELDPLGAPQPTMAMPPPGGMSPPPPPFPPQATMAMPPQPAPGMPASSPPQPPAAPGEAPLAPPLPPPPPPMP